MLFLVVVFALFIILAILYDILLTILSQQGAGPVTTFWTRHVRRIYLAIHYRRKSGATPVNLAPLILAFTFLFGISHYMGPGSCCSGRLNRP